MLGAGKTGKWSIALTLDCVVLGIGIRKWEGVGEREITDVIRFLFRVAKRAQGIKIEGRETRMQMQGMKDAHTEDGE